MTKTKTGRMVSAYLSGKKTVSKIKEQYQVSGSTFYQILENAGVNGRRSTSGTIGS